MRRSFNAGDGCPFRPRSLGERPTIIFAPLNNPLFHPSIRHGQHHPATIHRNWLGSPTCRRTKAARQRWEMAQAVVPQVQTLPDPTLQLGYQKMPMVEPFQGFMDGVGQEIPFPGKLRLKGEVA